MLIIIIIYRFFEQDVHFNKNTLIDMCPVWEGKQKNLNYVYLMRTYQQIKWLSTSSKYITGLTRNVSLIVLGVALRIQFS